MHARRRMLGCGGRSPATCDSRVHEDALASRASSLPHPCMGPLGGRDVRNGWEWPALSLACPHGYGRVVGSMRTCRRGFEGCDGGKGKVGEGEYVNNTRRGVTAHVIQGGWERCFLEQRSTDMCTKGGEGEAFVMCCCSWHLRRDVCFFSAARGAFFSTAAGAHSELHILL